MYYTYIYILFSKTFTHTNTYALAFIERINRMWIIAKAKEITQTREDKIAHKSVCKYKYTYMHMHTYVCLLARICQVCTRKYLCVKALLCQIGRDISRKSFCRTSVIPKWFFFLFMLRVIATLSTIYTYITYLHELMYKRKYLDMHG